MRSEEPKEIHKVRAATAELAHNFDLSATSPGCGSRDSRVAHTRRGNRLQLSHYGF
ncbi:MAG: hypothetical protein K8W52_16830 [Deltaproteobacteria bacterium]|nr:hypothetical protein [Deltaproteobacteria bacterium]